MSPFRLSETIDNLLSVDIVTADGRVLTASATSHPDLFWGVRGGGGNFGIVTAFEFRMHAVGQVLAGKVVYPRTQAREVLRFYREYTSTAPDEECHQVSRQWVWYRERLSLWKSRSGTHCTCRSSVVSLTAFNGRGHQLPYQLATYAVITQKEDALCQQKTKSVKHQTSSTRR